MSIRDLYLAKRGSAADAMREVRDGDFIIVPTGVGEPPTLLEALSEQRRNFHDVKGCADSCDAQVRLTEAEDQHCNDEAQKIQLLAMSSRPD
jgi:hypothetical protein